MSASARDRRLADQVSGLTELPGVGLLQRLPALSPQDHHLDRAVSAFFPLPFEAGVQRLRGVLELLDPVHQVTGGTIEDEKEICHARKVAHLDSICVVEDFS